MITTIFCALSMAFWFILLIFLWIRDLIIDGCEDISTASWFTFLWWVALFLLNLTNVF